MEIGDGDVQSNCLEYIKVENDDTSEAVIGPVEEKELVSWSNLVRWELFALFWKKGFKWVCSNIFWKTIQIDELVEHKIHRWDFSANRIIEMKKLSSLYQKY